MLQVPVLFGVAKLIVFNEAAIIIAVEGNEGILNCTIGHQHDLFILGRGFVIPGFDDHRIERDVLGIFAGSIGPGPLWVELVTGQKACYTDELSSDVVSVFCFLVAVRDLIGGRSWVPESLRPPKPLPT